MAKAFFCIPSARPVEQVIPVVQAWKKMGYGVALQRDLPPAGSQGPQLFGADLVWFREYEGYADAVNFLSDQVLRDNPEVEFVVCGGDDTFPDPNKTGDEIAEELSTHFGAARVIEDNAQFVDIFVPDTSTFGVCQPTGDRWADDLGVIIERIAGSPWLGRSWCERAWGGRGPLWPEFHHQFVDEALQVYAKQLGVFLQRPDLTHYHAHAQRVPGTDKTGNAPAPGHMAPWNTRKHWDESKAIFERLKAENFASCMPIP